MKKITLTTIVTLLLFCVQAQNVYEVQKLVSADRKASVENGNKVEIYGKHAILSSYREHHDENGLDSLINAGAVYVFEKQTSGAWLEIQKIVSPTREEYDDFGSDIAIYDSTIVIGCPGDDYDENEANFSPATGAAYVFDKQASGLWTLTQKVTTSVRQIVGQIGSVVDIYGDHMLIGSFRDNTDENFMNTLSASGAVYMYTKDAAGLWTNEQKLVGSDRQAANRFGMESDLIDGKLIVSGQPTTTAGKAYVFSFNALSGLWIENQILTVGDVDQNDGFGTSVAISEEFVVVGAPNEAEDEMGLNPITNAGAIYLFNYNTSTSQYDSLQKIAMPDRTGLPFPFFGQDVEITVSNEVYAGASASPFNDMGSGAVYRFENDNSTSYFYFDEKFGSVNGQNADMFGYDFDVDGKDIIVGARGQDTDVNDQNYIETAGGAFIFKACKTKSNIQESACESYLLPSGTALITTAGVYNDTISNVEGCDSIITIDLTINALPVTTVSIIDELTLQADSSVPTDTYQWADCDDNYSFLAGEVNSTFEATANGNYAVIVTSIDGCSDTSACNSISTVDLDEFSFQDNFKIFPNPSNGEFTIRHNGIQSIGNIRILDLTGKVYNSEILEDSTHTFNLSLPKGLYIVEISNGDLTNRSKIIIQ